MSNSREYVTAWTIAGGPVSLELVKWNKTLTSRAKDAFLVAIPITTAKLLQDPVHLLGFCFEIQLSTESPEFVVSKLASDLTLGGYT